MTTATEEKPKSLVAQLREQVKAQVARRDFLLQEADLLEEVLAGAASELGEIIELATDANYTPPKRQPAVEVEEDEEEVDGKTAAKQYTLEMLKKSGKMPLGEDELAIQLLRDGFQTDMDEEDFVRFVYDECVVPLIEEDEIEAVGTPPNRKFKVK